MRSMTGYGRIEENIGNYSYTVEIKSLNGKHLNIKVNLPWIYSSLEIKINDVLKKYFKRGSLNVYIDIRLLQPKDIIKIDKALAKSYFDALNELASYLHLNDLPNLELLVKFKEIMRYSIDEKDLELIWNGLEEALVKCIENTLEVQQSEGKKIKEVLKEYINKIEEITLEIEKYSSKMKEYYKEKLRESLKDMNLEVEYNKERLEYEIALIAERGDITEEIDRLKMHVKKFREVIDSNLEVLGQNLDFLTQEMHREFNTIASKSKLKEITALSIDGRLNVNKIKEQVQNIH
ncbi:TIGR00255 family protein [Marinitoga hydrogenitolerans DSM 16785]|uniref:TIGR00255 family protein n=1 Tax=Marinitoga hydrogenitolerans (strain DSM 16785 / JCM 12826 / AT1271) TaxID=1122195 RepID=A0A1M4T1D5_MARH1|nr:YicC/YloC family endoribonuclease [Marinitoga hydrogenitolerans]SHE38281.1 TIGR00255 family protein [Marinitoga hydrogenitolerans DSM 16785]